jgi:GTP-binding protein LepA
MEHIRNFCIIAHIDHGKSTLADRLLQVTGTISDRQLQEQTLDDMDLERERGITIKSHAIQMQYTARDGKKYIFNLIDTPGHVDFSYEVSRSIAACEGALLIVDATQGIEAQTISNLYLALEHDLEVIPILNKMDLPSASPEEVGDQIIDLLGCKPEDIIPASGKTGLGVDDILEAIVHKVKPPKGDPNAPLQAMVFDSVFNSFRGIIAYYRILNGTLKKGDKVKFFATEREYEADEIGVLGLDLIPRPQVGTGDVGYIISGIKNAKEVKVGDTITLRERPCLEAVKGFEDVKPMVFAGIYPVDTDEYEELRASMEKLQLNDASLVFEPESSAALGFGFRCGFLGMLHMEIVQERLEREFDMTVITTVPNVSYHAYLKNDTMKIVNNPSDLPDPNHLERVEEPYIKAQVITKSEYIGQIMTLCIEKRGVLQNQVYLTSDRVELSFSMPLGEIVFDFYDKLKSVSRGYASFDYFPDEYKASHLARETISALRKDVTAKCYGGDITRKRKLLEKQKKGKKRMRQVGNVEVPQSAFLAVLKLD